MTVKDITDKIEAFAPLSLQAGFDNSGLIVGTHEREIHGLLIAVDLTEDVIAEAESLGVDMIVTHHPIIFSGLKRLNSATYVERCVALALQKDIAIYAAHTNLDSAKDGMSWRLGKILGLQNMSVLEVTDAAQNAGFGVVGELAESIDTYKYIDFVANKLSLSAVRHSDVVKESVQRVAICTGSGGSMIGAVKRSGADIYITADLRYNDFFEAQKSFTILDAGHYESEFCAIELIFDIICGSNSKKMINFAVHKSVCGRNPVHYRCYK